MQVILLEKITHLGELGDIVKVKDGYARNYLIPTKRAKRATQAAIAEFEQRRAELEKDSWAQITEEVISFTVPQAARDPRFVNSKNMWEQKEDGAIVPDTFADDLSLLVKGDKGVSVVLGCAHAGLPNILNYAQKTFGIREFDTVLGGTHLSAADPDELPLWIEALKQFKVKCWRPNHCTGFKAAAAMARAFDDVDWAGCGAKLIL